MKTVFDTLGRERSVIVRPRQWLPGEDIEAIAGARIIGPARIEVDGGGLFEALAIAQPDELVTAVYYCRWLKCMRLVDVPGDAQIPDSSLLFAPPRICDECKRWGYHLRSCSRRDP